MIRWNGFANNRIWHYRRFNVGAAQYINQKHSGLVKHLQDLQTITEFGFDRSAKLELAKEMGLKGGYRIVPTGKALEFNPIWDGVELMSHFTRLVTVP